jgi:hypothetical protein
MNDAIVPEEMSHDGLFDLYWTDTRDNSRRSECGGLTWDEVQRNIANDLQECPFFVDHEVVPHNGPAPVVMKVTDPFLMPGHKEA